MQDCLFCKIARKELPAETVYEDDATIAFLDIKPVNPGHVLVVPKAHYPDFASTPAGTLADVIAAAQRVALGMRRALGAPGFNIAVNNGAVAGQVVPHVHVHVMPRREGDGYELWHGAPYQEGEMADVGQKLRQALS